MDHISVTCSMMLESRQLHYRSRLLMTHMRSQYLGDPLPPVQSAKLQTAKKPRDEIGFGKLERSWRKHSSGLSRDCKSACLEG